MKKHKSLINISLVFVIIFSIFSISLKAGAAVRPTILENIKADVTGTEILVSVIAKWEDEINTTKERSISISVFDSVGASDSGKTLIEEKIIQGSNMTPPSDYIKNGSVNFSNLKPEKEYLIRAYLVEKTKNSTERIKTPLDFVIITTGKVDQKTFTTVQDPPVYVSGQLGAVEKNDTYKLLVPLPGLTCMDPTGADKNCIGNNIMYYLNFIFKLGIGVCAALAVVMLIIYGVVYMGDESVFSKTESKKKMMGAVVGLVIALGSWMLLNTINPDLTGKNGFNVAKVSIDVVRDRIADPEFLKNLDSLDVTNILPLGYNDDLFLGYLAHQQGAGGASAILWANSKGLNEVPTKNPFTKADVNRNMKNNFYTTDAMKIIKTSELTPSNFLKYWSLKTAAAKARTNPILPSIETALRKVSAETGVSFETLVAICRIESAAGCTTEKSITTVNSGGYSGLFQIGSAVWKEYGNKNANILDPYENALAAAKYYNANIRSVRTLLSKN